MKFHSVSELNDFIKNNGVLHETDLLMGEELRVHIKRTDKHPATVLTRMNRKKKTWEKAISEPVKPSKFRVHFLICAGIRIKTSEWSKISGVPASVIRRRVHAGWYVWDAIFKPIHSLTPKYVKKLEKGQESETVRLQKLLLTVDEDTMPLDTVYPIDGYHVSQLEFSGIQTQNLRTRFSNGDFTVWRALTQPLTKQEPEMYRIKKDIFVKKSNPNPKSQLIPGIMEPIKTQTPESISKPEQELLDELELKALEPEPESSIEYGIYISRFNSNRNTVKKILSSFGDILSLADDGIKIVIDKEGENEFLKICGSNLLHSLGVSQVKKAITQISTIPLGK